MISIDDFAKVEFKVGTIISAEELEGSDKLLKFQVDFGPFIIPEGARIIPTESEGSPITSEVEESQSENEETDSEQDGIMEEFEAPKNEYDIRQVLSGIKQWYKPEELVNKQFVFVTNLTPRKMMGLESQAMIMAAEGIEKPIPLTVSEAVPNGAGIR